MNREELIERLMTKLDDLSSLLEDIQNATGNGDDDLDSIIDDLNDFGYHAFERNYELYKKLENLEP